MSFLFAFFRWRLPRKSCLRYFAFCVFFFSPLVLYSQETDFTASLYQSEQAAILGSGGTFFSYGDNYSSLDTSLLLNDKNFYFLTSGLFARGLQNFQIQTISSIASGNLFVGTGSQLEGYGTQADKRQHYFFNLGLGKRFNHYLSSGFLLRPLWGKTGQRYYANIAFHYVFRAELIHKRREKIFALHSLQLLAGISNLGVSWFSPHRKEDSFLLALHTQWISTLNFSWRVFTQVGWRIATKFFTASLGTEFAFYFARLRLGYINDTFIDKNAFTFGIGFFYAWQEAQFKFDYAFSVDVSKAMYHALVLSFAHNIADKKPPRLQLQTQPQKIASADDQLFFITNLKEKSRLNNWQLRIKKANGQEVAFWQMDKRGLFAMADFGLYFKDFFQDNNRKFLSKKISWNFFSPPYAHNPQAYNPDLPHKSKSLPLADGVYNYFYFAQDNRENRSQEKSGSFVIDRTAPQWNGLHVPQTCSPNVLCKAEVNISGNPQDILVFRLYNSLQETVSEKSFSLAQFSGSYLLDTSTLREGAYRLEVEAFDNFGNRKKEVSDFFYIQKNGSLAGGTISSPLVNYKKAPLVYSPRNFSHQVVGRWLFRIQEVSVNSTKHKSNDKENNNKQTKIIYEKAGSGIPPDFLTWNGKDIKKEYAEDGKYQLVFKAYAATQNSSAKKANIQNFIFRVDTTPPRITLFSPFKKALPDQDNFKDRFRWRLDVQDSSDISSFDFKVFEHSKYIKPIIVKSWQGTGKPPKTFFWDARSPSGSMLSSFSRFYARLNIKDAAGNESTIWQKNLKTGVSGEYSQNQFVFSLPLPRAQAKKNIETLSKELKRQLRESYHYILRYPDYKILVQAHLVTDASDEENLLTSEKLARLVASFLISKGIAAKRISVMGMGESEPLYDNQHQGAYGNYKNQRITFTLYAP